tara:strand:+ start:695 stop:1390 length:696 start_codon:yes stop_codon:yes gene_type:complete
MTQDELNKSIESLIVNKPENTIFTHSELNYLRKYDKCEDSGLSEAQVFEEVWKRVDRDKRGKEYTATTLVTHGGSGKAITTAPLGESIHVFNDDYFCHVITRALTSGRMKDVFMNYDFGTIAEYFYLGNSDFLPAYDLVISQPPKHCQFAELDGDEKFASLAKENARIYYAVRAFKFVRKGGALMLIVPRDEFKQSHIEVVNLLFEEEGADFIFQKPHEADGQFILKYNRL